MSRFFICLFLVGWTAAQMLISPPARECRDLDNLETEPTDRPPVPQYTSGKALMVKAELPAVKGSFEFYLCPEADPMDEDCLIKLPLDISESGRHFDMSQITTPGQYVIPLQLPEGLICEACILKWVVKVKDCDDDSNEPECIILRDTMCADIAIQDTLEREPRGWSFLEGALGKALHGAAKEMVRCTK